MAALDCAAIYALTQPVERLDQAAIYALTQPAERLDQAAIYVLTEPAPIEATVTLGSLLGSLSGAVYRPGQVTGEVQSLLGPVSGAVLGKQTVAVALGSLLGACLATARSTARRAHLLPPNATSQERASSSTLGRSDDIPTPLRDLWHVDTCPPDLLPWLAWAFHVDAWDPLWSEFTKRQIIRESVAVHRRKGTLWAIRRALVAAGYPDPIITEGGTAWTYGDGTRYGDGHFYGQDTLWAVYAVAFATPITAAQATHIRRLLATVAPARCHLSLLTYDAVPWVYGDGTRYGPAPRGSDQTYYAFGD